MGRDCSIVTVSCTECQQFRKVVLECPVGRHGNTFCPRRAAKNGNYNTFCPRRAAENGNYNTFCPRRAAENGNGNTFCPRRAAKNGNGNTFCPRRAAKGHEERQLQLPFVHEGPRRTTKGREGPRRTATATPFCPRRAAKNGNCNFLLSTKGREERQLQLPFVHEGPRRTTKGREGPRRTATATPFCPRRAAKGH